MRQGSYLLAVLQKYLVGFGRFGYASFGLVKKIFLGLFGRQREVSLQSRDLQSLASGEAATDVEIRKSLEEFQQKAREIEELDKKIIRLQQSTKTSVRSLRKL
ncbi:MAG: hypothetical protein AAB360_03855, partial [Patescibacteria group bacterium]